MEFESPQKQISQKDVSIEVEKEIIIEDNSNQTNILRPSTSPSVNTPLSTSEKGQLSVIETNNRPKTTEGAISTDMRRVSFNETVTSFPSMNDEHEQKTRAFGLISSSVGKKSFSSTSPDQLQSNNINNNNGPQSVSRNALKTTHLQAIPQINPLFPKKSAMTISVDVPTLSSSVNTVSTNTLNSSSNAISTVEKNEVPDKSTSPSNTLSISAPSRQRKSFTSGGQHHQHVVKPLSLSPQVVQKEKGKEKTYCY